MDELRKAAIKAEKLIYYTDNNNNSSTLNALLEELKQIKDEIKAPNISPVQYPNPALTTDMKNLMMRTTIHNYIVVPRHFVLDVEVYVYH
ncbi:hypothetical protein CHS0354_036910, partial [Potamilus streckersoni]